MRLTANRAYKVSQIFGRLSDHCVPDGAFKCLLKKYPALSVRAPFSGAGPGRVNEAKLIAQNCSSFTEGGGGSRTWENRIYFSFLKSRITGVMFPAYLNILLVTHSLQKPSEQSVVGFLFVFVFLMKLWTRVVWLSFYFWDMHELKLRRDESLSVSYPWGFTFVEIWKE